MANQEQVKRLLAGVKEWNEWRETYQGNIDLSAAELREAHLKGANLGATYEYTVDLGSATLHRAHLEETNLEGAYLYNTCLEGASLYRANLGGAYLNRANLTNAHLREANLQGASLTEATLQGANLQGANLNEATLERTVVSHAYLFQTIFSNNDLRETKGLLELHHAGPSEVVLQTVHLPQDGSALVFLRGAGVSDEWIELYKGMRNSPIQYHSLFISYASEDQALASRLHADLQNNGVRCWFAPHDLVPGDHFREKIDRAIQVQDKLLLILSKASVQSQWVAHEVQRALNREANQDRVVLFPIRIDEEVMQSTSVWAQDVKENRHIGDFTGWESSNSKYQERFATLLTQLRTESKRP